MTSLGHLKLLVMDAKLAEMNAKFKKLKSTTMVRHLFRNETFRKPNKNI